MTKCDTNPKKPWRFMTRELDVSHPIFYLITQHPGLVGDEMRILKPNRTSVEHRVSFLEMQVLLAYASKWVMNPPAS